MMLTTLTVNEKCKPQSSQKTIRSQEGRVAHKHSHTLQLPKPRKPYVDQIPGGRSTAAPLNLVTKMVF